MRDYPSELDKEKIKHGEVRDFFTHTEGFAEEVRASGGNVWMLMHTFYSKFNTVGYFRLPDLARKEIVYQAPTQILRDQSNNWPLLVMEEDMNLNKGEKELLPLAQETGRNVYLSATGERENPVLPEKLKFSDTDPWKIFAELLKQCGVKKVYAGGMFLHEDLGGCVGLMIKKLKENGLEVVITKFGTPYYEEADV